MSHHVIYGCWWCLHSTFRSAGVVGVCSTRYDDSYAVGEGGGDDEAARSRTDTRRISQQPKAGDTSDGREALLWKGQKGWMDELT